MEQFNSLFNSYVPTVWPVVAVVFFVLMIWSVIWKGLALWKAAQQGDKYWFVALLVINTVGILEILYIYVFSKKKGIPTNGEPHSQL